MIDLLVQQYEQFVISKDESIDSAFARFNTIITSLKALNEGYSSKNYVRKFLRALHPKWRAKVLKIKESKDLTSLPLDELIGISNDEKCSTSKNEDEEYAMAVRDFKKFFKRRGRFVRQPQNDKRMFQRIHDDKKGKGDRKFFRCGDPNYLIRECPKPPKDKNQKSFRRRVSLAYLKLSLWSFIYRVWKKVDTPYQAMWDMAYWDFLESSILHCYLQSVGTDTPYLLDGYDVLRKFLRALHPKWRAKVTMIEVSKDLTSLSLDELIENLKVHEMIIKKDYEIVKTKGERKSLALKAKKESSDEECLTFKSSKEAAMTRTVTVIENALDAAIQFILLENVQNHRKTRTKRAFVGGSWSDSSEDDDEKIKNKTCLVDQASSEVFYESSFTIYFMPTIPKNNTLTGSPPGQMEFRVSTQTVAVAKLLVLNPNEFKLWKMRIEQYFLITDYALWEVILNGDSPPPTRSVKGVETPYPPTTIEEKLSRKNELKARGNKESKKIQKTILKQQCENFNGTSSEGLDQIYDRLQNLISHLKIHGETISLEDLNLKLLRSLPSEWKTHTLIWRNKPDLETLSMDDLGDGLKVADGNVDYESQKIPIETRKESRECRASKNQDNRNREAPRRTVPDEDGPTNFALMAYISSSSSSSSNSNTEVSTCSKAYLKSYKTLKEHYDNLTKDFNKSQFNLGAYKGGLASDEARIEVYKKNEVVFEDDIKILKLDVMLRDKAITELRQKFKKAKKERDDLKLTLEKFEGSSKYLSRLFDSQQSDKSKTGLGYDSQGVDSQVLENQVNDKYNTGDLEDMGVASIVTSSSSSGTISKHLLRSAVSSSATTACTCSSNFCFLALSYSSSSLTLLELSTALSLTASESIATKLFT
uniref:Ribonuclease H-like domain-containing protein n=1 Tax=Tanacetum cinerariifolium TaxID=118510 RepID=A0A6L2KWI5_TANCI|nr:ribonuclease H-like domain-containing protein [Tanacetum cinerariifolium]